jgi:hypothetical protein
MTISFTRRSVAGLTALALFALPVAAHAGDPVADCEKTAAKELGKCVKSVLKAHSGCVEDTGAACAADDANIVKALGKLTAGVAKKCKSDADVVSVGYGPNFTVAGLSQRLASACTAETNAVVRRTIGGPHGAAYAGASGFFKTCMIDTVAKAGKYLGDIVKNQGKCLGDVRKGKGCDTTKLEAKLAKSRQKMSDGFDKTCPANPSFEAVIALTRTQYLDRTAAGADCLTAMAHGDNLDALDLTCGPRADIGSIPTDVYTQVVLPNATFGTLCGDGSDYAFQVYIPSGADLSKVLVGMEGGGVCVLKSQCDGVGNGDGTGDLFEALSDGAPTTGIMSNNPSVSAFADWVKVYLPYCNQDVFTGGGLTTDFGDYTVARYGAINVREAVKYVRDVLWSELDATTDGGYYPDAMQMMFGGFSAGGFGTIFNYHWTLDDLGWARTTAFPDSALGLNSGSLVNVTALADIAINGSPFVGPGDEGWGTQQMLPPYCPDAACAEGPVLMAATSERLKEVPEQQLLILSNQVDATQIGTTGFSSTSAWINAARQGYCDTKDLPGIHYFMPATTTSRHVISLTDAELTTDTAGGEVMGIWLEGGAITDPDNVVDRADEGTLVADHAGTNVFPCTP